MIRSVALVLTAALVLSMPAGSTFAAGGDATGGVEAAAKKKCKKGFKRKKVKNKKGKRVSKCVRKKKRKLSGPVPADGDYFGRLGSDRFISVAVRGNRKRVTVEVAVPQSKLVCTPSMQPARGGQNAKLILPIKADGSFSGSDQTNAGRGPGAISGRFVNQTTVRATASVSGRTNGGFDDTCAGSDSYQVKLKPGRGF